MPYTYLDFLSKFGIGGAHPGGLALTNELLSKENITKDSHILDVGCGTGQTSAYLYKKYHAHVYALENNPRMLKKAKKRFTKEQLRIPLINAQVELIPVKDHTIDFVLSESVLAFVNKSAALREIFRVLKNEGRLVAIEMTLNQEINQHAQQEIKEFYGVDSLLMEDDWRTLLLGSGFTDIEIKQKSISDFQIPEFQPSKIIAPELHEIARRHQYMLLKYQHILTHRTITATKRNS
ncbi:class I SAM-dependent methyltransferase [Neobacillus sp. D3-1R]|uniref:class I SAM-dependent methyltransferase n=1 Tax=Neobacillus sp. D3-1R TaxID=3445778 RepID=UPI003F9F0876